MCRSLSASTSDRSGTASKTCRAYAQATVSPLWSALAKFVTTLASDKSKAPTETMIGAQRARATARGALPTSSPVK